MLRGFDSYEKDIGRTHPFGMKGGEPRKRGASTPLTNYQMDRWMAEISIGTPAKTFTGTVSLHLTDTYVYHELCHSRNRHSFQVPSAAKIEAAASTLPPAGLPGTWGWSSVWTSASAAYQQARTVVDEQVKHFPRNEQFSEWGEGVLEYAKTAQLDKLGVQKWW